MSLWASGTPCSAPRMRPRARSASSAAACLSAPSASSAMKQLRRGGPCARGAGAGRRAHGCVETLDLDRKLAGASVGEVDVLEKLGGVLDETRRDRHAGSLR